jgi:hypothetical protein
VASVVVVDANCWLVACLSFGTWLASSYGTDVHSMWAVPCLQGVLHALPICTVPYTCTSSIVNSECCF